MERNFACPQSVDLSRRINWSVENDLWYHEQTFY